MHKRAVKVIGAIAATTCIYAFAVLTLPICRPLFSKLAVVSAGLNLFEGGISFVRNQADTQITMPEQDEVLDIELFPEQSHEYQEPTAEASANTGEPKPEGAGKIERRTYTDGNTSVYVKLQNSSIKNCTTHTPEEVAKTAAQLPNLKLMANGKPEVLIMHTHATESYQPENRDWFVKENTGRTTDCTKNVVRVGDEIAKQLEAAGIGVIHDTTLNDYPSYNGSYERSAKVIKAILAENPTIKVVLDVHRDAIQPDADTMIAPVATVNGRSAAQIMIISGCDNGKFNMPNYMENLKLSAALQEATAKNYKGLMRPVLFDYRKYNQDLTTGSILLEMGGHANTLDEAIYSGELIGKSLAELLCSLK